MPEVPLCGGCDNSDTGDCDACLRYMEYVRKRNKAVVNELLKWKKVDYSKTAHGCHQPELPLQ